METVTSQVQHLNMTRNTPPLLCLPTELILAIGEAVHCAKDLACLRGTCLVLNKILQAMVGRRSAPCLTMDPAGLQMLNTMLTPCSTRLSPMAPFITRILLADLGHACDANTCSRSYCLSTEALQAFQAEQEITRLESSEADTYHSEVEARACWWQPEYDTHLQCEPDVKFTSPNDAMRPTIREEDLSRIANALAQFPKVSSVKMFLIRKEVDVLYNHTRPFKLNDDIFEGASWQNEGELCDEQPPSSDPWEAGYEIKHFTTVHEAGMGSKAYRRSFVRPGYIDLVKLDALMPPHLSLSKLLQRLHMTSHAIQLRNTSGSDDDYTQLIQDAIAFIRRCDNLTRLRVTFGEEPDEEFPEPPDCNVLWTDELLKILAGDALPNLTHLRLEAGYWWKDDYVQLIKGRTSSLKFLYLRADNYNVDTPTMADYLTPFIIACTSIPSVFVDLGPVGFEQFHNGRGFAKLRERMAWRWSMIRGVLANELGWLEANGDEEQFRKARGRAGDGRRVDFHDPVEEVQDPQERAKEYVECFANVRFD